MSVPHHRTGTTTSNFSSARTCSRADFNNGPRTMSPARTASHFDPPRTSAPFRCGSPTATTGAPFGQPRTGSPFRTTPLTGSSYSGMPNPYPRTASPFRGGGDPMMGRYSGDFTGSSSPFRNMASTSSPYRGDQNLAMTGAGYPRPLFSNTSSPYRTSSQYHPQYWD